MTIHPLSPIPMDPLIVGLPKADLHLHQEAKARLELLAARRQGRLPYDRHSWARRVLDETLPGMSRLGDIYEPDDALDLASDIPVTLSTDLPAHVCTTIGQEYAIAHSLGFSTGDLLWFTRNAVQASFTTAERRAALMAKLQQWDQKHKADPLAR